jgi:prefoldin subunit 5
MPSSQNPSPTEKLPGSTPIEAQIEAMEKRISAMRARLDQIEQTIQGIVTELQQDASSESARQKT